MDKKLTFQSIKSIKQINKSTTSTKATNKSVIMCVELGYIQK